MGHKLALSQVQENTDFGAVVCQELQDFQDVCGPTREDAVIQVPLVQREVGQFVADTQYELLDNYREQKWAQRIALLDTFLGGDAVVCIREVRGFAVTPFDPRVHVWHVDVNEL